MANMPFSAFSGEAIKQKAVKPIIDIPHNLRLLHSGGNLILDLLLLGRNLSLPFLS